MSEIGDQFKGLPMESLIGGPLSAAITSNRNLAQSTADFINSVGFNADGTTRMVDFSFERPGLDGNGNRTIEVVKIKTPMLAVVPIPNLQIDVVDITFDMEVKNSTSSKESLDMSAQMSAKGKIFGFEVSISGSIASHKENTRSSDQSAKYHVNVHATNHGIPEGMARVLDIMSTAAAPRDIKSFPSKNGELPDGAKTDKGYNLDSGTAVNDAAPETDADNAGGGSSTKK